MGFFVLILEQELAPARVATILGSLFSINAQLVNDYLSPAHSRVCFELRHLHQAAKPRGEATASIFFFEINVYPQDPQMQNTYRNEAAFASAFAKESRLSVLISAHRIQDPYIFLLLEEDDVYLVDEWPEDEQITAITVTSKNKKPLS